MLATVYWSLGGVATVAVLLVGFGWWTNFRVYERDKASLERTLLAELKDTAAQTRAEQMKANSEQFDTMKQELTASTASIEARLSGAQAKVVDAAEKRLGAQVATVKASTGTLGNRVLHLELAAKTQERLEERERKSFRNALQTSVEALEIANELDDEYAVGNALDLVAEDIRTILAGNDLPIDNFLVSQVIEVLNAVKGTHAHSAAALRAKASTLSAA